jgi:hypothetical protein
MPKMFFIPENFGVTQELIRRYAAIINYELIELPLIPVNMII